MPKARCVDCLLDVHAEHEQVDQQLGVSLGLHATAHQAKAHPWRVGAAIGRRRRTSLCHEAGDQRVKRTLARCDGVRQARIHRECSAAVVEREAGARHHQPGAEVVIEAVDERHHVACAVRRREVDRLARRARRPGIDARLCPRRIKVATPLRDELVGQHMLHRHGEVVRIAEIGRAHV